MEKANMKLMLLVAAITITANLTAQHSLEKIWQTDSTLKVPESVLYDAEAKVLYVANIDGSPSEKDGNGSIAKVGLDGKIIDHEWITGLDAPKGMGLHKNLLYVANISEVAVIDIDKASIIQRIPVEGSAFLNDLTVDSEGIVHVSDSRSNKVHRIENGIASLYLEDIRNANGLLAVDRELYILSAGSLLRADADMNLTTLAEGMDGSTDGIEMVKETEFIVSCWSGIVYYVKANGSKEVLLDTRDQGINSADIGYDAEKRIIYVPTFFRNSVFAYRLK
jgi:DNA-binding beta-propeller fold protein YncE